jgi:hypothetical protein
VLGLGSLECEHALDIRGKASCLLAAESGAVWAGTEDGGLVMWSAGRGGGAP